MSEVGAKFPVVTADDVLYDEEHHQVDNKKRSSFKRSSKSSRKKKQRQAALEEERLLAASLFGRNTADEAGLVRHQVGRMAAEPEKQQKAPAPVSAADAFTFEIDRVGDPSLAESALRDVKGEGSNGSDDEDEDAADHSGEEFDPTRTSFPAWVDEDDDHLDGIDAPTSSVQVDLTKGSSRLRKLRRNKVDNDPLPGPELEQRLRERFRATTQTTARTDWAQLDHSVTKTDDDSDKSDDDDGENFTLSASTPLLAFRRKLAPHTLSTKRCPDANQSDPNQAVVQAVGFHPGSDPDRPLLLTAGLDKSLRFFQVTEERSNKIHGIHFPNMPIFSASFLGLTGNVLVSGRRSFFYLYDSHAGKVEMIPRVLGRQEKSWEKSYVSPDGRTVALGGNDGYVVLWDVQSRSWRADVKMNGTARAVAFTSDSNELLTSGSDGDVYRWDLRMNHRCVERFANQDGTITSSLAASSRTVAVGAESGVVNLYAECGQQQQQHPPPQMNRSVLSLAHTTRDPFKSIMNLKTAADHITFNSDGQILAVSSRRGRDSLRLVHVPTGTVFANWPTSKSPLGYVWCTAFGPGSKFLAVGNDRGKCLLYKLMHYEQNDDVV